MSTPTYCVYSIVIYRPVTKMESGLPVNGVHLHPVATELYRHALSDLRQEDENARLAIDEFGDGLDEIEWDYTDAMLACSLRHVGLAFLVIEENMFDKTDKTFAMFFQGRMSSAKLYTLEPDDNRLFRKIFQPQISPYDLDVVIGDLK